MYTVPQCKAYLHWPSSGNFTRHFEASNGVMNLAFASLVGLGACLLHFAKVFKLVFFHQLFLSRWCQLVQTQ